jgi:hypothetical protein
MWKLNVTYWVEFWKYAVILPKQAFFALENVRPAIVMKARESRVARRTGSTPQRQRDEAQRRDWTIYEVIIDGQNRVHTLEPDK